MKDPRRLKNDPDRAYRAVHLRADEAARLTRDVENEYADGCPHLDVFKSRGWRSDGSTYQICNICAHLIETPPNPALRLATERDALEERTARHNLITVCLLAGVLLGALAMRATIALGWWS